jgi:hypothetical protein
MAHMIEALKKALEMASTLFAECRVILELSARSNHNHLSRSDKPMSLRSSTPSPPKWNGFWTCDQATAHLPPYTDSVPDHRNAYMILMRALHTHPGSSTLRAVRTGIAASVVLIKVSLPLLYIKAPFHTRSLSVARSINYCQEDLRSLETDWGIPRYRIGKSTIWHGGR